MLPFFQFTQNQTNSACNFLVEADCSKFGLVKCSLIIGFLVKVCSNLSDSLAQRWRITATAAG